MFDGSPADHAPHTREEKAAGVWDAPSGVPGVETALPLLLEAAGRGQLSYERVRDLTATNPATVFGLPGKGRIEVGRDADLVLVDPADPRDPGRCPPLEGRLDAVRGSKGRLPRVDDGPRAVRLPGWEFGEGRGRNVRTS